MKVILDKGGVGGSAEEEPVSRWSSTLEIGLELSTMYLFNKVHSIQETTLNEARLQYCCANQATLKINGGATNFFRGRLTERRLVAASSAVVDDRQAVAVVKKRGAVSLAAALSDRIKDPLAPFIYYSS
ncbi:hypothetical protein OROGR_017755 [Orobanche gracilis]